MGSAGLRLWKATVVASVKLHQLPDRDHRCRRLVALDAAVTAVAKGISALRQLAHPEDDALPANSALLAEATAAAPAEGSEAVQALMDIDEGLVKAQPAVPAKVSMWMQMPANESEKAALQYLFPYGACT